MLRSNPVHCTEQFEHLSPDRRVRLEWELSKITGNWIGRWSQRQAPQVLLQRLQLLTAMRTCGWYLPSCPRR